MRHMASIGIGNCIGGVHRCGTWPASVSATASPASIDAAPGQHRYRHRPEPWTRRMPWHGRRWRQHRRLPSMWHLAIIGIGIGGIHQYGTWPASVSSSSGTLDAKHALAWPALASASTTSTRRWVLGEVRLQDVVSGQLSLRRGVGWLSLRISAQSTRPSHPQL